MGIPVLDSMELLVNNFHYIFGFAIAVLMIAIFAYLQGASIKVLIKGFMGVFLCSYIVVAILFVEKM